MPTAAANDRRLPRSLAALLLAAACTTSSSDRELEFADVAPVLRTHCVGCHQPGGLSPLALVEQDEVRHWASAIAVAVANRTMPPIPAVADGSCRTFRNAQWLGDDEIDLLVGWAEAGAPPSHGIEDVGPLPPVPHLPDDAPSLAMAETYVPVADPDQPDAYRCFVLRPELTAPAVLTATEFIPGERAIVHHAGVFAIDPRVELGPFTNGEAIALMEADDPEPGWSCFGGLGAVRPRSQLSGWVGGSPVVALPRGAGMTVFPGELWILQVHYRSGPDSAGRGDRTTLRLELADDAEQRITAIFQDPLTFASEAGEPGPRPSLAPGLADAQFSWELDADVLWRELEAQEGRGIDRLHLVGVGPHMHTLGRSLELDVIAPDGTDTCGLAVEHWDFAWQDAYFYDDAIAIDDRDARLRVTCHYDTRTQQSPVFPGHDAGHEMCGVMFYVSASPNPT